MPPVSSVNVTLRANRQLSFEQLCRYYDEMVQEVNRKVRSYITKEPVLYVPISHWSYDGILIFEVDTSRVKWVIKSVQYRPGVLIVEDPQRNGRLV